jgi:NADPH:quinone reductase-like Zn-dependent oxidoreductase
LTPQPDVILGSDGAGIVLDIGKSVKKLTKGQRVVTHIVSQIGDDDWPVFGQIINGLGQTLDGTLCEYGIFPEECLIEAPTTLSFEETATLTCSGLTAWNALFGLRGREVKAGDWVVVQGTGGVSIAALQVRQKRETIIDKYQQLIC